MGWNTENDSQNNAYEIFKQEHENSCGPACVLTVLYLTTGKKLSENTMHEAFGDAEGAVNKNANGIREFDDKGSNAYPIVEALHKFGSKGWFRLPCTNLAKKLTKLSPKKPAILGVDWGVSGSGEKGGHWVCAVRNLGDDVLVCLDPINGIIELRKNLLPFYFTDEGQGKINDILMP